jgi:hypothetical protein
MKLPGADRAIIDEAKLRDYLLSPEHPVGRFKARVFAAAGYDRDNWEAFRNHLLALASTMYVEQRERDAHGTRFVGTGEVPGLAGQPLPIVTVWLIPSEGEPPRFITAYPGRSS